MFLDSGVLDQIKTMFIKEVPKIIKIVPFHLDLKAFLMKQY